jgi:hypothetical protein
VSVLEIRRLSGRWVEPETLPFTSASGTALRRAHRHVLITSAATVCNPRRLCAASRDECVPKTGKIRR